MAPSKYTDFHHGQFFFPLTTIFSIERFSTQVAHSGRFFDASSPTVGWNIFCISGCFKNPGLHFQLHLLCQLKYYLFEKAGMYIIGCFFIKNLNPMCVRLQLSNPFFFTIFRMSKKKFQARTVFNWNILPLLPFLPLHIKDMYHIVASSNANY